MTQGCYRQRNLIHQGGRAQHLLKPTVVESVVNKKTNCHVNNEDPKLSMCSWINDAKDLNSTEGELLLHLRKRYDLELLTSKATTTKYNCERFTISMMCFVIPDLVVIRWQIHMAKYSISWYQQAEMEWANVDRERTKYHEIWVHENLRRIQFCLHNFATSLYRRRTIREKS